MYPDRIEFGHTASTAATALNRGKLMTASRLVPSALAGRLRPKTWSG